MGPVAAAVPYRSAPHPDAGALIEILEQARTLRRPSGCSFANCKSESAGRSLQLRPGEGDILHDHGPGALARHSRTDMAAARGHVTKPMSAVFRVAGTGSTRADAVVIRSHASLGRQPQAVRLESKFRLARQLTPDRSTTRVSGIPVDSATRKWPTMKKFFCSMSIPGSVVRQTDEWREKMS